MNRREFLGAGAATAVATSSNFFALDAFAENPTGSYKSINKPLDHFVEQYLRAMNTWTLTKASVRLRPSTRCRATVRILWLNTQSS